MAVVVIREESGIMAQVLVEPDRGSGLGLKFLPFWIVLLSPALQPMATAESHGALKGTVTLKETGEPLHHVSVAIEDLGRSTVTEHDGAYEFEGVPPGTYHLVGHLDSLFTEVHTSVTIDAGTTTEADIVLELLPRRYEVTVTGHEEHETVFEAFQSIESLGPYDLAESANVSVGELLDHKVGTGIAKRGFGPGASRPIIRGFDGDRILILEDGVRTGSLASQSGDHGELINPAQLERMEIVKGSGHAALQWERHGGDGQCHQPPSPGSSPPPRGRPRFRLRLGWDHQCIGRGQRRGRVRRRRVVVLGPGRRRPNRRLHGARAGHDLQLPLEDDQRRRRIRVLRREDVLQPGDQI